MIGAALSSFILAGVLSTFLFLGRSGANIQNYNDMESQARSALELLYQRQVNVMGIVFNSVETKSREYNYFKYPEYYSKGLVQK